MQTLNVQYSGKGGRNGPPIPPLGSAPAFGKRKVLIDVSD